MRNPLWRLKTLPWLILLQNAALTVLIATVLDILLILALSSLSGAGAGSALVPLLSLLGVVLPILAGIGMGALAVLLMERFFRQVLLDTAVLWALTPCLALMLILKNLIPQLPSLLVALSYPTFVGIVLGVFVKGKRHWRY
ncbi:MAG TPA: hypothetical protein V6D29_17650 [Leptolyngbyaceae cyanobacterium]